VTRSHLALAFVAWVSSELATVRCQAPALQQRGSQAPELGTARGQTPPRCVACRSAGRVPCPEHPKEECAWEDGAWYCSAVDSCATCGGTAWLECASCDNAPVRAELEFKRALLPALRPEFEKLDSEMGRELNKGGSAHFVLVWELDSLKVDKKNLGAHELLHLYLRRLEAQFADYCATLGASEKDFAVKTRVFVWKLVDDQREASERFCGGSSERAMKLMGAHSDYSLCGNRQYFNGDEALHRNVLHSVAHLLVSHQAPSRWLGNIQGGWVDEGLAHWFEERNFGICDTYCYQEQNTNVDFKGGRFRVAARKLAAAGEMPPLAEVLGENTDTLSLPEHVAAFSLVDYLIAQDGPRFGRLCMLLRERKEARDALKEVYGLGPLELESRWKSWVLETYPTH